MCKRTKNGEIDPSYTEDWFSTNVQKLKKIIFLINDGGTTGYANAKKFNFDSYTPNTNINSQ